MAAITEGDVRRIVREELAAIDRSDSAKVARAVSANFEHMLQRAAKAFPCRETERSSLEDASADLAIREPYRDGRATSDRSNKPNSELLGPAPEIVLGSSTPCNSPLSAGFPAAGEGESGAPVNTAPGAHPSADDAP